MEKGTDENNNMLKELITSDTGEKKNQNETSDITVEILPKSCSVYDKSIKVILLGDSGVGKTSLLNCLEYNDSDINQRKTISLEYFNFIIKVNNNIIRMQIWDTVGHEKFNSIISNYYKTTDVAIFMYSIDNLNSFNNINIWYNELNDKGNDDNNNIKTIKILLGNKNDLESERQVTFEMGEKLKNEKNFYYFQEINCFYKNKDKDGSNEKINNKVDEKDLVQNLFFKIGKVIYKEYLETKMERVNSSAYNYEATNSILAASDSQSNTNNSNRKSKSCNC